MATKRMIGLWVCAVVCLPANAAGLKPETIQAWDEYIRTVESRVRHATAANHPFLWIDQDPVQAAKVARGEILTAPETKSEPTAVPFGLIHDWVGAVFIPDVTLTQVFDVVHDYGRYGNFYGPEVADAALLCRSGQEERIRVRYLRKVLFVSEALESEYSVRYTRLDQHRWYSIARSERLREIHDPVETGASTEDGSRYVWRIYSLTKYEKTASGVYVEQENIVLSPPVPASLQWLVGPVIRHLSREIVGTSLRQTREAVLSFPTEDFPAGTE